MDTQAEQPVLTSPVQQRVRAAADNIERLRTELTAECQLRDRGIVEMYEAHERVDTIARDARLSRARILAIVGAT